MKSVVFSAIVAGIVALGVVWVWVGKGASSASAPTVYDRIITSGVIRCGYFVFDPLSHKDETGKMSGIAVDMIERMAKNAGLTIEWTEEVTFAELIPGLIYDRYDAVCTPMWPNASRAREAEFVVPSYFAQLGVWVRPDDTRFDGRLERLNSPDINIAGIDGQIEQEIQRQYFPKARMFSLPAGTDYGQSLLNVSTRKADASFVDITAGIIYNRSHADYPLRNIASAQPLRVFPFSIAVKSGEIRLKNLLDRASEELIYTGEAEQIVKKGLRDFGFPENAFLYAKPAY